MDIYEYLNACLGAKRISVSEMARRTSTSPQNLNQKLMRKSLRAQELQEIAENMGAEIRFVDKDGKIIL